MRALPYIALLFAAILEVWGDRTIGKALSPARPWCIAAGCGLLALYGLAVNGYNAYVKKIGEEGWDFAHLLGLYVAFFGIVAVAWSAIADGKKLSGATILGVFFIVAGGVIIYAGNR